MKNEYEVYVGCKEWQEVSTFNTLEEARKYIENIRKDNFTMGLYSADTVYIKNESIDFYEDIET